MVSIKEVIMNKQECIDTLKAIFDEEMLSHESAFECRDGKKEAQAALDRFFDRVRMAGMKFGNTYHAHGIGNNNEKPIYVMSVDEDGFIIEKNVAKFSYVYGIYGGILVKLRDYANDELLRDCGRI